MQFGWRKNIIKLKLLNATISKLALDNNDAIEKYKMMLDILSYSNKKEDIVIFNSNTDLNKIDKSSFSIDISNYYSNYLIKNIETNNIFEPELKEIKIDDDELIKIITGFFNYYDKEKGLIVEKILKNKNFIELSESEKNVFGMSFYIFKKEPYIYINKNQHTLKIIMSLIHEMSHIISYIEYSRIRPLLIELPSLNAEINAFDFLKTYGFNKIEIDKLEMSKINDYINIFINSYIKYLCAIIISNPDIKDKELGIVNLAKENGYIVDREIIEKALDLGDNFVLYAIPFFYTYMNKDLGKKGLLKIEKELLIGNKKYAFSDFENSTAMFNEYTKTLAKKIKD